MPPLILVSYDGTANDDDALALGQLLAGAGARLALAYVRHLREPEEGREMLEERHAEELLERGARRLGNPDVARHVIFHASTGDGLRELAEREGASVIVFGSEYRTPVGSVSPGTSAQRLLSGGPTAVGIAPAGMRDRKATSTRRVGLLVEDGDDAAERTARALAAALGGTVAAPDAAAIDLLVLGSRPEAPRGRVVLSAAAERALETAVCPVLVTPRAGAVEFREPVLAA